MPPYAHTVCLILLLTLGLSWLQEAQASESSKIRAIAFDAFPIFDPRPIAQLAEEIYPDKGSELMNIWRARQFEYQWLRALANHYVDFMQVTEESLVFAAGSLNLDLSKERKERLMSEYMNLTVWPDAAASLKALHEAGFRLVFLSNMTEEMIQNGLLKAGLSDEFEAIYSTNAVQSYKPAPSAYQIAVDQLQLPREEILFVAFAGWDVAGAKWFGYPTYWVNRLGSPMEELGVAADAEGKDLQALVKFLSTRTASERR